MKKYLAEMIGTMVLVLMGCGAAVSLGCTPAGVGVPGVVGTALAFGLAVVAMAYAIGGISGCHINPAITLGVLVNGGISVKDAVGYWVGQFIGGILAAACLAAIVGMEPSIAEGTHTGANGLAGCNGNVGLGLVVEIVLTALFVLVVLGATSKT
ncbi:MAG: aquaporin, partial [Bacteroidaceae bacterium]|nr:aquaporin [Bacteroidaceae bacterium]